MRVIKPSRIREYAREHVDASSYLMAWLRVARKADWTGLHDLRRNYPRADGVQVASGNIVTVFNVCGNKYRLITAIKYSFGRIYVLRFLTHAEYDKEKWKAEL